MAQSQGFWFMGKQCSALVLLAPNPNFWVTKVSQSPRDSDPGPLPRLTYPGSAVRCDLLKGRLLELLHYLPPPLTLLLLDCHAVHCSTESRVSLEVPPR